ncbi:MAG TPA: response regulator transcription factor, partial [Polyangiaceae bacterium]|nr:response regulator transcription factor [Polyangiaceae bacterium]
VEDHRIVREGLRAILDKEAGITVVGEAADGREAIQLVQASQPDVVVMDVSMPGLNGIDATKKILAESPKVRVIGLSMSSDRRYVLEMLASGAAGYLVKNAAGEELVRAIRTVAAGQTYLSPQVSGLVVNALVQGPSPYPQRGARTPTTALSTREREVLQLLAEGLTSKDIAARLGVAVSTIETHRKQIMSKLELRSIAELTKYAVRLGLTPLE